MLYSFRVIAIQTLSLLLMAFILPINAHAQTTITETQEVKGSLAIIGGALRYDNASVWKKIVAQAGGAGAKIIVIPAASAKPLHSGDAIVEVLKRYGANAIMMPLSVKLKDGDGTASHPRLNRDPQWIAEIKNAGGVYFTGGDQRRITQVLLDDDGQQSPLLQAIWSMYRAGGLIAGSSAGAAIMSETMFSDAKSVFSTLQTGVRDGHEIGRGLGFIGSDIFIDQHLIIRGRLARMLPVMLEKRIPLGLGIDENTAMFVHGQKTVEVLGYKGAIFLDFSLVSHERADKNFALNNASISYLSQGDKLDLSTKQITPSSEKTRLIGQAHAAENDASAKRPKIYTDILANTVALDLMINLVESAQPYATGLAFEMGHDTSRSGFEFKFSKTPETNAHYTNHSGADEYTIIQLRLDVKPIKLKKEFVSR